MSVAVLIPYRPGCQYRAGALEYVLERHAANEWPVVIGRGADEGPWIKAHAVADALRQTHASILVVADADVWTDGLPGAVAAVRSGTHWAIPHGHVHRLTQAATGDVRAGASWEGQPLTQKPYWGTAGGGVLVVTRDALTAAPLDPRFEGWGQDDEAHALALQCLAGTPWRGVEPLVHLWHPPQERMTRRRGNPIGWALYRRYLSAAKDPPAMKQLLKEACHDPLRADEPARNHRHAHGHR